MTVEGKRIIVTGCASGIGAKTAKLLTERGATVIALDRNPVTENCEQFIQIDLADEASIAAAVEQIDGRADALCNIAGVPPTLPPIPVIQVNFVGLRLFTEHCIPKLNDGASIVNVSSLAGINWQASMERSKALFDVRTMADVPAFIEAQGISEEDCYEFSKEALTVWTMQCWNRWQDRGIRVNAVSPSATKTPILDDFMETVAARLKAKSKPIEGLPGPGAPEDIAPIIAFLCGDDSRWLNGANLIADGGLFAARVGQRFGF
ncbi:MAG: coniferyl-alcohol dehydrogenase [Chloroflexota bacterium]